MSDEVQGKLQGIVRQVFGDPNLVLAPEMTAADIAGWDSLSHVNLMIAVERRFGVRFSMHEISSIRASGKTVGDFVQLIAMKIPKSK